MTKDILYSFICPEQVLGTEQILIVTVLLGWGMINPNKTGSSFIQSPRSMHTQLKAPTLH